MVRGAIRGRPAEIARAGSSNSIFIDSAIATLAASPRVPWAFSGCPARPLSCSLGAASSVAHPRPPFPRAPPAGPEGE
eukprot:4321156-Pyramimonas_sp.AAC.1